MGHLVTPTQDLHPLATDEALRRRLILLARRWLLQADEAEDMVQDAYLRTSAGRLPLAMDAREAWLVTVLHHLCIDTLRRHGRHRKLLERPDRDDTSELVDEDEPGRLVDQARNVERALAHLVQTLAAEDVASVMLYEVFGYGHAELGALAGHSEAASRQRLHRLLMRLRSETSRPRPGDRAAADDDSAACLLAMCRYALAQRDPAVLIDVLCGADPKTLAAASIVPRGSAPSGASATGVSTAWARLQNLLALLTGATAILAPSWAAISEMSDETA